jgi:energy-coupling factor transporter ATP-binding protein EcfA2
MSYLLNPHWYKKLLPAQQNFILEERGVHFLFKFLFKKGHHLFIIGTSGSGKTQKAYWLLRWIKTTREIPIWIDSAKNGEMLPLLTMGTPVNIICPKGCDVRITEYDSVEKKYVPMKDHPSVVQVPDAGSAWWAVKKGHINIFCFRVAFTSDALARDWMAELFTTLSVWIRKHRMPHILPFALFGDESHWFLAGEKITSDTQRKALSELITELSLEDRAHGARLVLMAQSHKSLPPASRENMIHTIVCRGCKVSPDENNTLSPYNEYSSRYQPNQGVFVYEGGFAYPANNLGIGYPWPFPFFPMPKLKVEYIGEFDDPRPEAIAEQEIQTEMQPDLNKYQGLIKDLENYEIPHEINRYEIPQEINADDE